MPRSRTRARNRRAHVEKIRADFMEKLKDPAAFAELLRRLAASDHCVWHIARGTPLKEDERAMIAQSVAPRLAGMTPGSVYRRYEESSRRHGPAAGAEAEEPPGMSQVSSLSPEN
jgi:hypothetical protein